MNVFKIIEDHGLNLHGDIEHFAELVRADEREACAKVAEEGTGEPMQTQALEVCRRERARIAEAIRARGER